MIFDLIDAINELIFGTSETAEFDTNAENAADVEISGQDAEALMDWWHWNV